MKVAGADVEVDRDVCIGAGMCVMNAPEVFDQDDEGIVVVLEPEVPAEHAAGRGAGRGELPLGSAAARRRLRRCRPAKRGSGGRRRSRPVDEEPCYRAARDGRTGR